MVTVTVVMHPPTAERVTLTTAATAVRFLLQFGRFSVESVSPPFEMKAGADAAATPLGLTLGNTDRRGRAGRRRILLPATGSCRRRGRDHIGRVWGVCCTSRLGPPDKRSPTAAAFLVALFTVHDCGSGGGFICFGRLCAHFGKCLDTDMIGTGSMAFGSASRAAGANGRTGPSKCIWTRSTAAPPNARAVLL